MTVTGGHTSNGVSIANKSFSERSSVKTLCVCAVLAFLFEVGLIGVMHYQSHREIPVREAESTAIEADIVEMPHDAPKLVSAYVHVSAPEKTISISKTATSAPSAKSAEEAPSNQTQGGKPLAASHGPVLYESPSPVIPDYLKNEELKKNVVIEFTITAGGLVTPRLLSSSGNEELDQIALSTAKRWKFYPAENNHAATDAKVKLRILFDVK